MIADIMRKSAVPTLWLSCFMPAMTSLANAAEWRTVYCVNQAAKETTPNQTSIDAKHIIDDISARIGLRANDIAVIACDQADKAFSDVSDGSEIAAGKYILFNPDWLREIAGRDQVQVTALFGHELGHFLSDHFGADKNLTAQTKEAEADHFAGCAVARMGYSWGPLEDLLNRIRQDPGRSQLYPDRLTSVQTAKDGFKSCGGQFEKQCRIEANGVERWDTDTYVTRESGWRGGGGNPAGWCAELTAQLRTQYTSSAQFESITSSERTRSTCSPFNCTQYNYACTIHVLKSPIYKLATSTSCP